MITATQKHSKNEIYGPVGSHCILELYDCSGVLLNDVHHILESLREASHRANATVLKETFHKFDPIGVTALFLLSESHLSIHTWPEANYAAIDAFTCGSHTDPQKACLYLNEAFKSKKHSIITIQRNLPLTVLSLPQNAQVSSGMKYQYSGSDSDEMILGGSKPF